MSFGGALYLGEFNQGLITQALGCVVLIHRVTGPIYKLEHRAIRTVGIMGYRHGLNTFSPESIHPVPEPFWILAVKS